MDSLREFNVEGVCIAEMHYMVNIDEKLSKIINLIQKGKYFTINRARQYGKTTTLSSIFNHLESKYVVIKISFEGIGDKAFENEGYFIETFINLTAKRMKQTNVDKIIIEEWEKDKSNIEKLEDLSDKITLASEFVEIYLPNK